MNAESVFLRIPPPVRRFAALALGLLLPSLDLPAQTPVGSINGRIFSRLRGEYVRDALVQIKDSTLSAVSEDGGVYQLTNVTPGEVTLVVTYTGYRTTTATVRLAAGQSVTRDFELDSAVVEAAGADEVVRLGEFVVASAREGNAKAIMSQRRTMNITNSVASDVFGDIAEGNVAEFLKHIPGVELSLVEGEARNVRLRGLGAEYTAVTLDGVALASADASVTASDARAFSFEQISLNSMESIEVAKTISADVDANAPAGTINLKTKRAFDREGRRISWQANTTAYSEHFHLRRTYGPTERKTRKILPGGIFEYSDLFLNRRLGVVLNLSESNVYSDQSKTIHTWNFTRTTADQRPAVITAINAIDGPRTNERFTATLTSDFKATAHLTLSLALIYNHADLWYLQRGATFSTGARTTVVGAAPETAFATSAGNGSVAVAVTAVNKRGRTLTSLPKFEYKKGSLTLEGKAAYSGAESWYSPQKRGATFNVGSNTISGVNFRAERSSADSGDWRITQISGPDWTDGAYYSSPAVTVDDGRMSETRTYSGEINATLTTRTLLPIVWKSGAKVRREEREFDLRREACLFAYTGPGARATGNWVNQRSPYDIDLSMSGANVSSLSGGPVFVPSILALGSLYREHPEYFTQTLTVDNYYNANIAYRRKYDEEITAAYAMATTDLGRLRLRAGLRWEDTSTDSLEFDPLTPRELAAVGIAERNGRALTIPGLEYQYFSQPRIHRRGSYANFFPSASAKWRLRDNLEAHAGYSRTIRRPTFANIAGVWAINDEALTVTAPNPGLKPEFSDNLAARLAYYFEPVGTLALNIYQNTVTDLHTTIRQTASEFGYTGSPELAAYTFITSGNSTERIKVRGMEWEYSQSLSFLPRPFRGLNVRAGYTRNYSEQPLANLVPHSFTAGLSYAVWRISAYASCNWNDAFPLSSTGTTWRPQRTTVDAGGGYRLSRRVSFFWTARNLLNAPLRQMQSGGVSPGVLQRYEMSGTSWTFGVKGTF